MLSPFTALPTLLGPRTLITHGLQRLMGCILPTMHCRSEHCWELLHPFARSLKMADTVIAFFLLLLLVLWRACNIDLCTRWYGIFQHANTSNKTRRKGSGAYLSNNKRKLGMFITSAEREVKDSRRSANVSKLTFLGQDWARKVSRFSVLFGYLTK